VKDLPFFLTVEEVLAFHADQIREFGGSEGIRDAGGLDSAVAQARATFDGEYLHRGPFEMAAAYAFHIAENQPFSRREQAYCFERRHRISWAQWIRCD
jgi:death-on-curing protein